MCEATLEEEFHRPSPLLLLSQGAEGSEKKKKKRKGFLR
jgi:hypothetical protein